MELLSPAGNIEKLEYCYTYGADAAYIGLKNFSLRVKADNFYEDEYKKVIQLKQAFPGRRLHCALNISFHNDEIDRLKSEMPYFKNYPIDAFIVQDLGIVPILQKEFPNAALHLSTQASCMNREAVKMYKSIGFSRVVMGREASLKEIAQIKEAVPEMEIECFVHGAMCIAYSGRCLMSAYVNGRSGQSGFCSHTCRWDYDVLIDKKELNSIDSQSSVGKSLAQSGILALREHERPDEYFPVYEGENFTAVLSSKDLCMIDHLADFKKAGVDSLKIEGRMKSVYYVALITQAYRKALDELEGVIPKGASKAYIKELYNVSHRPFSTGFYYNRADADKTASGVSESAFELAAEIGECLTDEQVQEVLEQGSKLKEKRLAEYNALVPQAKKAYDERMKKQGERVLDTVCYIEGYKMYNVKPLNMINKDTYIEVITPNNAPFALDHKDFKLVNPVTGEIYNWCCDGHPCVIYTDISLCKGALLRAALTKKTFVC